MALHQALNTAVSHLTSPHVIGDGLLVVANGSAFGTPTTDSPLRVVCTRQSDGASVIFSVTSRSSNTLTIGGVLEGTTDIDLAVSDSALNLITAGAINDLNAASLKVGNIVSDAAADRVLFVDGGGNLADSEDLTWNGTGFSVGGTFDLSGTAYLSGSPAISHTSTDRYIWSGSNSINVVSNDGSATRLSILNSGNVGVGTNNPLTALHSKGAFTLEAGGTDSTPVDVFYVKANGYPTEQTHRLRAALSVEPTYSLLAFETNTGTVGVYNLEQLVLVGNGRVGIGTKAPGAQLQVTSGAASTKGLILKQATSASANPFEIQDSTGGLKFGIDTGGSVYAGSTNDTRVVISPSGYAFTEYYSSEANPRIIISRDAVSGGVGGIALGLSGATAASSGAAVGLSASKTLSFYTSNGTALTQRATFNQDGVLKIGSGSSSGSSSSGLDVSFHQHNQISSIGSGNPSVVALSTNGTIVTKIQSVGGSSGNVGTETNHTFTIKTNNTDRITVTTAGLVGIGTTPSGTQLQVNTSSASTKGLILKASASQTALMLDVQNSGGSSLATINASGGVAASSFTGGAGYGTFTLPGNGASGGAKDQAYIASAAIDAIPLAIRAFSGTGQTANLTEWRNSGDIALAWITPNGEMRVRGLISQVASKTAAYTLTTSDATILGDATSGAFNVTLPLASAATAGRIFTVKKIDSSGNAVTLTRAGSDLIDGANTFALSSQNSTVTVQSDGASKWWIVSKF